MVFTMKGAVTLAEVVQAVEGATKAYVDHAYGYRADRYEIGTKLWGPRDLEMPTLNTTFPQDVDIFDELFLNLSKLNAESIKTVKPIFNELSGN